MARGRRTRKRGVYSVTHDDGTRSYIATWKEGRPADIFDPLSTRRRTVEMEAATFDQACLLQAEGVAAEQERLGKPTQSFAEKLGEWVMAMKYFEYRGRR